jgi:transposase
VTKYSEKQKRDAVDAYLTGKRGLRATAKDHNVGFASLRFWVAAFKANGDAGLRSKPKKEYDVAVKLQVLQRIRDEGLSYRQAAAAFDIRRFDQIGVWERAYREKGLAGLQPAHERHDQMKKKAGKRSSIEPAKDDGRSREELIQEIERLRMENAYLKKAEALVQDKSRSARKTGRGSCLN